MRQTARRAGDRLLHVRPTRGRFTLAASAPPPGAGPAGSRGVASAPGTALALVTAHAGRGRRLFCRCVPRRRLEARSPRAEPPRAAVGGARALDHLGDSAHSDLRRRAARLRDGLLAPPCELRRRLVAGPIGSVGAGRIGPAPAASLRQFGRLAAPDRSRPSASRRPGSSCPRDSRRALAPASSAPAATALAAGRRRLSTASTPCGKDRPGSRSGTSASCRQGAPVQPSAARTSRARQDRNAQPVVLVRPSRRCCTRAGAIARPPLGLNGSAAQRNLRSLTGCRWSRCHAHRARSAPRRTSTSSPARALSRRRVHLGRRARRPAESARSPID